MRKLLEIAFVAVFCVSPFVYPAAQLSPATSESKSKTSNGTPSKADYSKEAFVEEEDKTKIDFENDGSYTRQSSARIRIQSDAGLQQFSTLKFAYQSAVEDIDVDYVRVVKPDGSTISTTSDGIQDMPVDITRQAPFYSDLREKHIAVKGLSVGDVLEVLIHWHSTHQLVPGQFWYSGNFSRDFIVLLQEIQIATPRGRVIKWKSPELNPVISEQGTRRIYTWTRSVLEHKSADEQKKQQEKQTYQLARGKLPSPDIQISTFQSWDEIGAWYNELQSDRVKPNAEIRAKAVELTKGAKDDYARLRAIYGYVSTQIRYIGVAFGVGRYQPHSASEVLVNRYGDCKDKHTLMASLLDAVGIKAYPALINSTHVLDPEVPSPAQFDHVITAVPQGAGFLWLDTTAEVAPYGYLLSLLWDKQALMIPTDRAAVLVTAPEPSVRSTETFRIDAQLKDNGTLEGKIERTVSGNDTEVVLRSVFRRTPVEQWKQVVQKISYASGFSGDVSDVTASPPDKTDEPFKLTYSYVRKDYPQWSERRISSPLPPMTGIIPEEEPSHPIPLSIGEFRYESRVEVPKGYAPRLPPRIDLAEKFGEYHSAYAVEAGTLQTERTLLVKVREVPADQYDDFKKFFQAVSDDHELYVSLRQRHLTRYSYQEAIWTLPNSENREAAKDYDNAREQFKSRNNTAAIDSLERAVQVDPKFTRAWLWLAETFMNRLQYNSALDALRSAIANDPQETLSYKGLGFALMKLERYDDAVSAWQQLITTAPDDPDGPENLGSALFAAKRYSDAALAFESATKLSDELSTDDRDSLSSDLASAYLRSGNEDKALALYKKDLEMHSTPDAFNEVAYALVDADKQLPLALQYAEKAVHDEEEASTKVKLSELNDLRYSSTLPVYWDTLGWVYFRMGAYDKAESYLKSAWQAGQNGFTADHLGQLYEKQRKLDIAVHMYNLALEVDPRLEDTHARMRNLAHIPLPKNRMSAREELSLMRTIKVPAITKEPVNAYFDVEIAAGKIEKARFVSGSELLSAAGEKLEKSAFEEAFPPKSVSHLFRRGVLTCSEMRCSFVLYSLSLGAHTD